MSTMGLAAQLAGSNIPISIPSGTTANVTFAWDQVTHVVTHTLNN